MDNFQGKMLVSTPALDKDPNFISTVVYIYEQNPQQILGLILNRPSQLEVEDLVRSKAGDYSGSYGKLHKGGPVSPQSLILLHTDEWYSSNTIQVGNGLALSSDEFMLEKLGTGNEPAYYRMLAGVSTWHPKQLKNELESWNAWLVADLPDTEFVFQYDRTDQWDKALELTSQAMFDRFI